MIKDTIALSNRLKAGYNSGMTVDSLLSTVLGRSPNNMLELRCTVRNCGQVLVRTEAGLGCAAGHHFDHAREGYWNLTQPQDKKSNNPGDNREAVLARHRWLERGHTNGLAEVLRDWAAGGVTRPRVMDLGCGDGSFGPMVFPEQAGTFCGIDLSKPAIKLAAKRWPEATWILANADRGLPAMDSSVDCVMSLFGRRPVSEIRRVLSDSGICIVAVPAEDDLIELREVVQKHGARRSRIDAIVEEMQGSGLRCVARKQWRTRVAIGSDDIEDALAMTYRARRWSERNRIASIENTTVTLAADLMLFNLD